MSGQQTAYTVPESSHLWNFTTPSAAGAFALPARFDYRIGGNSSV
jgi:hypothetical protein